MSSPNNKVSAVSSVLPPTLEPSVSSRFEVANLLVDATHSEDPQHYVKEWGKTNKFRIDHRQMSYAVEMVRRYLAGDPKVAVDKVLLTIEDWKNSAAFEPGSVDQVVLQNLLAQLDQVKGAERAQQVLQLLPGGEEVLSRPAGSIAASSARDKYRNVGFSLRQDTVGLGILSKARIPADKFVSDQQYLSLRASYDFPIGDKPGDPVGMARFNAGVFKLAGVPGEPVDPSEQVDPGTGYRVGLDFGLVDPTSPSHLTAGIGLEVTGVADHAGQEQGVETPSPAIRLHLFKQSEIPIPLNFGKLQLGLGHLFNQQETYLTLGNGGPLQEGREDDPVAVSASLFSRNSLPLFVLSGRYYYKGTPDFSAFDPKAKMSNGEGFVKVVSLLPSAITRGNRAEDASAFATNQIFMALGNGTLGPQGSRDQFDTLAIGLTAYSVLDGVGIAGDIKTEMEILQRGQPSHQKAMFGLKAGLFLWHAARAATREDDPPYGDFEAYQKNPGALTDFSGRAANMLWKQDLWEAGLLGATYQLEGWTSHKDDPLTGDPATDALIRRDQKRYKYVGAGAAAAGLLGVLFAGKISGQGCGDENVVLGCTFPGTREKFFAPGQDFTSSDMVEIENHYVVSSIFASLIPWGVSKFLYTPPKPSHGSKSPEPVQAITGRLEVSATKVFVGLEGKF